MATATPMIVLYDGRCRFCVAQAARLHRLARRGTIETRDFHEPGALALHPELTPELCNAALQLVTPGGRRFAGVEGVVRALATRRWLAPLVFLYYVPGLRQLADALYRLVAANRYRLGGRVADDCDTGACRRP
jgi:predicted DCC family thiol-disulfide oxidoreductase YuxK